MWMRKSHTSTGHRTVPPPPQPPLNGLPHHDIQPEEQRQGPLRQLAGTPSPELGQEPTTGTTLLLNPQHLRSHLEQKTCSVDKHGDEHDGGSVEPLSEPSSLLATPELRLSGAGGSLPDGGDAQQPSATQGLLRHIAMDTKTWLQGSSNAEAIQSMRSPGSPRSPKYDEVGGFFVASNRRRWRLSSSAGVDHGAARIGQGEGQEQEQEDACYDVSGLAITLMDDAEGSADGEALGNKCDTKKCESIERMHGVDGLGIPPVVGADAAAVMSEVGACDE
jgi:hypothetical protein